MRSRTLALGLVLCVSAGASARAATAGNVVITSDHLSFDYKRYIAVFEGNVVIDDPQVHIEADQMTVLFEGTNQIKSVTAIGNVRMRSGDRRASCRRAVYLAKTGEVLLTGGVSLTRGRDTVMGEKVTFWLFEDRMECTPGRLVIYPERDFDLLPATGGLGAGR